MTLTALGAWRLIIMPHLPNVRIVGGLSEEDPRYLAYCLTAGQRVDMAPEVFEAFCGWLQDHGMVTDTEAIR